MRPAEAEERLMLRLYACKMEGMYVNERPGKRVKI
jgi:hypothetical protein